MTQHSIPVICIDGPTASGKGTLSSLLAKQLGFHLLDSGALYRITALAAQQNNLAIELSNEHAISSLINTLSIEFVDEKVMLNQVDVTDAIRTEDVGMDASTVSGFPRVRTALVDLQHNFQRSPGLIADGRDMGTTIFPEAELKVFLTAGAEQRARRRFDQLTSKGVPADFDALLATLQARDAQDSNRSASPLKPAADAILLDNSNLSIDRSVLIVLSHLKDLSLQKVCDRSNTHNYDWTESDNPHGSNNKNETWFLHTTGMRACTSADQGKLDISVGEPEYPRYVD